MDPSVLAPQTPAADKTPFVSRFNQWMKVIAIVVLAAFIPNQVSWAFGYNPAVLYRNLPVSPMQDEEGMTLPQPAMQVAGSLEYLLKQIQDKPKLRLELNLDAQKKGHTLEIDTKTVFNAQKISQVTQWLKTPGLNVLNCGVYALKDVLNAHGIYRSLQEISVMTLSVDIMANIVKVGAPKLKTTLFAINKTAQALGLNYQSLKVLPQDELNLKTPFIAHFKNEHFVTVQKAAGGEVYYTDLDYPHIVKTGDFLKNVDGFVFAPSPSGSIRAQAVPQAMQAFVWGDKWRDMSGNLPGIVSGTQLGIQLAMMVAVIVMSMFLPGATSAYQLGVMGSLDFAMFAVSLSQLTQALATICVMKGACSQSEAFILGTVIDTAITMGMGAGVSAENDAAQASEKGAQEAVQGSLEASSGDFAGALSSFSDAAQQFVKASAETTASHLATVFIESFATGLVYGFVKGVVELEITKAISNAICPDPSKCSDTSQILESAVEAVASSVGASAAVDATGLGLDAISGSTYFTNILSPTSDQKSASGQSGPVVNGQVTGNASGQTISESNSLTPSGTDSLGQIAEIMGNQLWQNAVPMLAGQAAGAAARIIASKAGVSAQDALSSAIGAAFTTIGSVGGEYLDHEISPSVPEPSNTDLTRALVQGLFTIGLGFAEDAVIGKYDKQKAKEDSAYANNYSQEQAQFLMITLVASSVASAAVMAINPQNPNILNTCHEGVCNDDKTNFWQRFKAELIGPGNAATSYNKNVIGADQSLETVPGYSQSYSPSELSPFAQNFAGQPLSNIFLQTGSWGSTSNFINYSDTLDEMTGYTAQWAVSGDQQWASMQKDNKPTYNAPGRFDGLVSFTPATPAVSNGTLHDQFLLSLFESRSLGNPGINIDYLTGQLQEAAGTSVYNLGGVAAEAWYPNVSPAEFMKWGLPTFRMDEIIDHNTNKPLLFTTAGSLAKDASGNYYVNYSGIGPNGDKVSFQPALYTSGEQKGNLIPEPDGSYGTWSWVLHNGIDTKTLALQPAADIQKATGAGSAGPLLTVNPDGSLSPADLGSAKTDISNRAILSITGGSSLLLGTPIDPAIQASALQSGLNVNIAADNGKTLTLNYSTLSGPGQLTYFSMKNTNFDKTGWSETYRGINPVAIGEAVYAVQNNTSASQAAMAQYQKDTGQIAQTAVFAV
ncbi:MAG: hypothetical protein KGJ09_05425, partial [Candidatus Omnitrophica bacterium]|nr:hypothetical protein [Candidatus Omnitrophota bacterium]